MGSAVISKEQRPDTTAVAHAGCRRGLFSSIFDLPPKRLIFRTVGPMFFPGRAIRRVQ
jgi:hypothetical protein